MFSCCLASLWRLGLTDVVQIGLDSNSKSSYFSLPDSEIREGSHRNWLLNAFIYYSYTDERSQWFSSGYMSDSYKSVERSGYVQPSPQNQPMSFSSGPPELEYFTYFFWSHIFLPKAPKVVLIFFPIGVSKDPCLANKFSRGRSFHLLTSLLDRNGRSTTKGQFCLFWSSVKLILL